MGNAISSDSSTTGNFTGFPPVERLNYETSKDKRDRTLKHLIRANHHNHAVLFHNKEFHNHLPHLLGSAYLFGATSDELYEFYADESKSLEEWEDSPGEISRHDWRDFIGKRESVKLVKLRWADFVFRDQEANIKIRYQRAFLDFFEDEMVRLGYNWKQVVLHYMLEGDNPLISGAIGGLGHPLIHLGYAFEFNNREVGMEALVLAATNYNFLHKYIDNDVGGDAAPQSGSSQDTLTLIRNMRADKRLDGLFSTPGAVNIEPLFAAKEDVILEYFHSYTILDAAEVHRELNKLSAILLCATHPVHEPSYDFFVCHLLTISYAVRTVLPELPSSRAIPLVKAHWLFIIVVYAIQLRPEINPRLIDDVDIGDNTWETVKKHALHHVAPKDDVADTHYLKALRTMEQSAKLWPEDGEFYLKAAVKLGWGFAGWTGFSNQ